MKPPHDLIPPPPVGWWPLAEVWWFLIVGAIGFVTWFLWFIWRNWHLDAYRREAQKRLAAIESLWRNGKLDNPIEPVNALLKQVAVTAYTPEQRGNMTPEQWAAFLRRSAVRVQAPEDLEEIIRLAYVKHVSHETARIDRFIRFAHQWIRRHHQ